MAQMETGGRWGRLYGMAAGLFLAFNILVEVFRWFFKEKYNLSEENTQIVFDLALSVIFVPILFGVIFLWCRDFRGKKELWSIGKWLGYFSESLKYWVPLFVTQVSIGFFILPYALLCGLLGLLINYFLNIESPYAVAPYVFFGALWGSYPLFFAVVVVIAEHKNPWHARLRSRELTKKKKFWTACLWALIALFPEVASFSQESLVEWIRSFVFVTSTSFVNPVESGEMDGMATAWLSVAVRLILGGWAGVGCVMSYQWYSYCLALVEVEPKSSD